MSEDDPSGDEPLGGEDPFEELDDGREREGDPFERLADDADGDGERGDEGPSPGRRGGQADPLTGGSVSDGSDADPEPGIPSGDPFAGYETPSGDPFESGGGAFDSIGDETVDPDAVWERLAGEEDADGPRREDVAEVSKHDFCERCEHFSPPPEVGCTHQGTEIAGFPDMETVRVVDCPIVAERRRLGGLDE